MKDTTKAILWMVFLFITACLSVLLAAVHYANGNWLSMILMLCCAVLNLWTMFLWHSLYQDYLHDEQQNPPL